MISNIAVGLPSRRCSDVFYMIGIDNDWKYEEELLLALLREPMFDGGGM